eukprot:TRINITY_DN19950_c0_g1::TRINITY_DN19950_c0_g1_i1::g.1254::m.1254 TRINITY_DN19950_c0_g1::TRINITY_DN19950_c0_g1_i1::g.1254  ORF type:complete len:421 (-),score=-2.00,Phage_int_SAM_1/PF02899.12/0.086,FdsD/PF11390.3/1.4e+04,FdsD/PF11390.3/0.14,HTH_26/PF13443.1/0.39 TRINITY_DN19950_c0_g1_i1:349-1575(-)
MAQFFALQAPIQNFEVDTVRTYLSQLTQQARISQSRLAGLMTLSANQIGRFLRNQARERASTTVVNALRTHWPSVQRFLQGLQEERLSTGASLVLAPQLASRGSAIIPPTHSYRFIPDSDLSQDHHIQIPQPRPCSSIIDIRIHPSILTAVLAASMPSVGIPSIHRAQGGNFLLSTEIDSIVFVFVERDQKVAYQRRLAMNGWNRRYYLVTLPRFRNGVHVTREAMRRFFIALHDWAFETSPQAAQNCRHIGAYYVIDDDIKSFSRYDQGFVFESPAAALSNMFDHYQRRPYHGGFCNPNQRSWKGANYLEREEGHSAYAVEQVILFSVQFTRQVSYHSPLSNLSEDEQFRMIVRKAEGSLTAEETKKYFTGSDYHLGRQLVTLNAPVFMLNHHVHQCLGLPTQVQDA